MRIERACQTMIATTTTDDGTPRERRIDVALMAIIFVASAVTIWWQTQNHFQFNADSVSYVDNAMRLSFCGSGYQCFRGPGYPLLIALTGVPLLNTFLILRIVQALMSVGIVVLIYQTLSPFHRRAALIAASLAMISAIPWVYSTSVMTEQLYLFVLCLFFFFASRSFDTAQPHRLRYFYAATFTIFELTIIKSSAAAFFVIWLVVAGLILRKPRHLAYAAALYFSLMIGWSLVDNIALSRGAKVRCMGGLARTEFAEAYYSGWTKVFERYQGKPEFVSAERGPASRELYDIMLRFVHDSPGNWVTLTPHALWGAHADNPAQLAEDLFAKPSQSYCEFIARSVHAKLGRNAGNALFRRVASEYIPTGIPRIVSNISFGVPTRYLGQAIFYHAYHCIDRSIISPENGPATRQLIEAVKQHFVMDGPLWQEAYDRDPCYALHQGRPPLSADTIGEIVFDHCNERYWELMWLASQELYGLEASDKLLRDVAIEAFSKHPAQLTYVLETAKMFVGFERSGELPGWSNLERLPYLNSHTQWLDEPLRAEVQGQPASLPVLEQGYGATHVLRLWLLLAALISIPLTYRNRPVFQLVVIMMAVSLCHGVICVCFSNYSGRNCDPMFLPFIVVAACGMSELPRHLSRYRRSSGHMNHLISMPRFEALQLMNLGMPSFPEHAASNDPSNEFDLTLFVACYNEEANIIDTLDTLIAALRECNLTWEIVVIDDASRDHSVELYVNISNASAEPDHAQSQRHKQGPCAKLHRRRVSRTRQILPTRLWRQRRAERDVRQNLQANRRCRHAHSVPRRVPRPLPRPCRAVARVHEARQLHHRLPSALLQRHGSAHALPGHALAHELPRLRFSGRHGHASARPRL